MYDPCHEGMRRLLRTLIVFSIFAAVTKPAWAVDLSQRVAFDIGPQKLSAALVAFSRQAKLQVVVAPDIVDRDSAGISGSLSIGDALDRLLDHSGMTYQVIGDDAITIVKAGSPASGSPSRANGTQPTTPGGQPAESITTLNDVTVTSSKRKASVRDTPGSVGVVTGSELEKSGAAGLQDYLKLVPGVTLPEIGNELSTPIIRGISTSIVPGSTQATTGIFLDETSLSDPFIPASVPDINPFDLERVEVLKGPVGTLFGADSLAGAIRYIPRKPQLGEFDAKMLAERYSVADGGTISSTLGGEVNLPLGSEVAVRVVGIYRRYNGLIDDLDSRRDQADVDRSKQTSTRTIATWKPLDRLQFTALYQYQRTYRADESFADQPYRYERADEPFPTAQDNLY